MIIRQQIEMMIEVNEIDREIKALSDQLGLYPAMLDKLNKEDARAHAELHAIEEKRKEARESRRKLELEIRAASDKVAKLLIQQNQVKTNKEFQAITGEIERFKGQIDEMETRGLDLLEAEDRLEAGHKKTAAKTAEAKSKHDEERARIAKQTAEKTERSAMLRAERDKMVAELPDPPVELYRRTADRYPGEAIVKAEAGACTGCGMRLAPQIPKTAHLHEAIVRCEFCRRILC